MNPGQSGSRWFVYQCPGCWGWLTSIPPKDDGWIECDCGERMTCIDLRAVGAERITHGRHCACSACARQDWSEPGLAPCGMHGPSCPPVYAPLGGAGEEVKAHA